MPEQQVNRVEATKKPVHHSMTFQDPMLQVLQSGPHDKRLTLLTWPRLWKRPFGSLLSMQIGIWHEHEPQIQPMEDPTKKRSKRFQQNWPEHGTPPDRTASQFSRHHDFCGPRWSLSVKAVLSSESTWQGHPTSIFGKYLFGKRFEI